MSKSPENRTRIVESRLKTKIDKFSRDNKLNWGENNLLSLSLTKLDITKNKESQKIHSSTREKLEILKSISGISATTKRKIESILSGVPITKTRPKKSTERIRTKEVLSGKKLDKAVNYLKTKLTQSQRAEIRRKLWVKDTRYVTLAQAVAMFQQQSGLVVDGQPWGGTKKALWIKRSSSSGVSESRERLSGKVWWKEARRLLGIGSKFLLYSSGRWYKESWANRSRRNRTSLEWLRKSTIKWALILRKYVRWRMVITWGTEVGHAWGTLSHAQGYKLDIDSPGPILKYLAKLRGRKSFPMNTKITRTIEGQKMTFYRHPPDHVDITFHP